MAAEGKGSENTSCTASCITPRRSPCPPSSRPEVSDVDGDMHSPEATLFSRPHPRRTPTGSSFQSSGGVCDESPLPKKPRLDDVLRHQCLPISSPAVFSSHFGSDALLFTPVSKNCNVPPTAPRAQLPVSITLAATAARRPPPKERSVRTSQERIPESVRVNGSTALTGVTSPRELPSSDTAVSQRMFQMSTPVATQLFEPDEPLTATQEAPLTLAEGYDMPSPPPFFGTRSEDNPGNEGDSGVTGPKRGEQLSSQQASIEWAEAAKAFFEFIDRRHVLTTTAT